VTSFDPVVATALEQIAPKLDADPEELLARARGRTRSYRRTRTLVVAAFVFLLLAGAAFGAQELDLWPWLQTKNDTTANFTVDPTQVFGGPVPDSIRCPQAGSGMFQCEPALYGPSDLRVYRLAGRAHAYELVTRESVLADIAQNKHAGAIPPEKADEMRRDAFAAGNDFFDRENVLETIQQFSLTIAVPRRTGFIYAPPTGVPAHIACARWTDGSLSCSDLRASENVPADAPIYGLPIGDDWVEKPLQSDDTNREELFRLVFGRDLTPAERRLLSDLSLLIETH
jgi:hypothetical protein